MICEKQKQEGGRGEFNPRHTNDFAKESIVR